VSFAAFRPGSKRDATQDRVWRSRAALCEAERAREEGEGPTCHCGFFHGGLSTLAIQAHRPFEGTLRVHAHTGRGPQIPRVGRINLLAVS
jgi:hypothetical protein